jgi:hypothetical protein
MFVPIACVFAALMAGIGSAVAATAVAGVLDPKDIQSTFFTGEAFTASTPANVKFKMTYTADGKVIREPVGKTGAKGEGTWKITKDGFCTTWKGSPANCFRVINAGANKWSIMKGTTVVATWSK